MTKGVPKISEDLFESKKEEAFYRESFSTSHVELSTRAVNNNSDKNVSIRLAPVCCGLQLRAASNGRRDGTAR